MQALTDRQRYPVLFRLGHRISGNLSGCVDIYWTLGPVLYQLDFEYWSGGPALTRAVNVTLLAARSLEFAYTLERASRYDPHSDESVSKPEFRKAPRASAEVLRKRGTLRRVQKLLR